MGPLLAGAPLILARVDRTGLPPYEGEKGKIYILQGEDTAGLKVGSWIQLNRPNGGPVSGKLTLTKVTAQNVVGTLAEAQANFPMKGDIGTPIPAETLAPVATTAPATPTAIQPASPVKPRRVAARKSTAAAPAGSAQSPSAQAGATQGITTPTGRTVPPRVRRGGPKRLDARAAGRPSAPVTPTPAR
jgi:hypothetical protein